MDRAYTSGASATPPSAPGVPSVGYPVAGNPGAGTAATKPGPWWYHMITEELRNLVSAAGLTPSHSNLTQVKTALDALYVPAGTGLATQVGFQQDLYSAATAGGTPNALTASFSPAITSTTLVSGAVTLTVRAASANATTTPTFTPNSGVVPPAIIVKGNNRPLAAGDIAGAGHWITLQWDSALTQWVLLNPATGVTQSGLTGFRNHLINGSFTVNQRAVSGTVTLVAGAYGHDRFKAGAAGCTYTFSTSGADTILTILAGSLQQVIEGANIEGGNYVMSWTGTAQGKIGAGNYAASGVTAASVTGGSNLTVEFGTGTLSKVQLEPGATASSFERRPIGVELSLCKRYYLSSFTGAPRNNNIAQVCADGGVATIEANGNYGGNTLLFDVEMRAAPTLNIFGDSSGFIATASVNQAGWTWNTPSALGVGFAATKYGLRASIASWTWYMVVFAFSATAEL